MLHSTVLYYIILSYVLLCYTGLCPTVPQYTEHYNVTPYTTLNYTAVYYTTSLSYPSSNPYITSYHITSYYIISHVFPPIYPTILLKFSFTLQSTIHFSFISFLTPKLNSLLSYFMAGTAHFLGLNFAKAFDVYFQTETGYKIKRFSNNINSTDYIRSIESNNISHHTSSHHTT